MRSRLGREGDASRLIVTERDLPAVVEGDAGAAARRDPENRLLARGPRFRLPAEMIRDQALALSGLLVEKIGGPSGEAVPAGRAVGGADRAATDYKQDQGRRICTAAACTRSGSAPSPPPTMTTFDAAGRETCVVRETRTNTPLQALNLLNDVTYVEAARRPGRADDARGRRDAGRAHRVRVPPGDARDEPEAAGAAGLLRSCLSCHGPYQSDPQRRASCSRRRVAARRTSNSTPSWRRTRRSASLILNLDETITKE